MTFPKRTKSWSYMIWGIVAVALLVALDQWTKALAVHYLKGQPSIPLIPGVLELQYLENRGAAFGIMQNCQWVFVVLCIVFLLALAWFYWLMPGNKKMMPLHVLCVLAAAGGIGNAIDRVLHNFVVDFIYFSLIDFPIFNVADCYVTVCAFALVILFLTCYREEEFSFLSWKKEEKKD